MICYPFSVRKMQIFEELWPLFRQENATFRRPEADLGSMVTQVTTSVPWSGLWPPKRSLGGPWTPKSCTFSYNCGQDINKSWRVFSWRHELHDYRVDYSKSQRFSQPTPDIFNMFYFIISLIYVYTAIQTLTMIISLSIFGQFCQKFRPWATIL